jgi:nitroreductase
MNAIDIIKQRRSIRSFDNKKISQNDIKTILECAMTAPTARNQQGFRFVVTDKKNHLEDISKNIEHGKMAKDASHAIVVCYEIKDETSQLYWQQDASACTQNILLSAAALGIGSVWVAIYPREKKINFVKEYFGIDKNIESLCIVVLGYKDNFLKEVNRYDESKVTFL